MPGLNRREALTLLGGAAFLGACGRGDDPPAAAPPSTPLGTVAPGSKVTVASFANAGSCAVTPRQTEGPYYIDVDKIRADIREDREGTPLRVGVRVLDADGCTPVKDAVFEIWHCDAGGLYSGFEEAAGEARFLRGAQVTDADGIAVITTIFPGWYRGRTVHIHAKVVLSNDTELTTQLYFDDAVTTEALKAGPYAQRGDRDTDNSDDGFYRPETTLAMAKDGDGYLGLLTIGVG